MSELAGRLATIKVSGTAVTLTAEATSTTDNQIYQITDAAKRVLDRDTTPTVLDDGVETLESYTVNKLNGIITFESVDALRGTITVTGKYLPMSTVAYAHNFSYNRGVNIMDITPFLATHYKRLAGTKFASGTLSQFDLSSTYFADTLVAGKPVVIEFGDTATSEPIRCWALLENAEMTAAIDNPQDEIVSFISTDELLDL